MSYFGDFPSGPLGCAVAITKSDATVYSPTLRGLYIGGAGNVAIKFNNDDVVTFVGLAVGVVHPICNIKSVMSTNTTATDIVCGK